MNIIIKITIIIIMSVLCCGFEKQNNEKANQIEFNGEVYPISWGACLFDENEELYLINLVLLPSTMSLGTNTDGNAELEGPGTLMGFNLYASTQTLEGSYSIPGEGVNEREGGQIYDAAIVTFPPKDGYFFEKEGQLNKSKSDDNYEISYTGKEDGGLSISAYYKGKLISVNK